MENDVIIIGGAFAGLTAAIYSARQGMNTLLITKDIGGQGLLTTDIQNYPGFNSISGFDLASKFQEQATLYGVRYVYDEVTEIKDENGIFKIKTFTGNYESEGLILAFGKTPRDLNVKGEEKFRGLGVSYCSICDGPLFKNKDVAVAGAGDHALQAALYLSTVASNVFVIQKGSRISGSIEMIGDVSSHNNVKFLTDKEILEIKGDKNVQSLLLKDQKSNAEEELNIEAVFVEMGYVAKTSLVKELVTLNKESEVIVDSFCATNHPGIFACGDVTNIPYKQAVISAGQGSIAALSCINYLHKKRGKGSLKSDWKFISSKKE
ncbi:MAG: NAD(P)/FAD-dependent oxidoreductase [Thermoplasmataceae archaeon]